MLVEKKDNGRGNARKMLSERAKRTKEASKKDKKYKKSMGPRLGSNGVVNRRCQMALSNGLVKWPCQMVLTFYKVSTKSVEKHQSYVNFSL